MIKTNLFLEEMNLKNSLGDFKSYFVALNHFFKQLIYDNK